MDTITLSQEDIKNFIAYVNTIPTEYGRPLLNWFDIVVAKLRQAAIEAKKAEEALKPAETKPEDGKPTEDKVVDPKQEVSKKTTLAEDLKANKVKTKAK